MTEQKNESSQKDTEEKKSKITIINRDVRKTERALERLESSMANHDMNGAFNAMLAFLKDSNIKGSGDNDMFAGFPQETAVYIATRFTAAVNFLFMQKNFRLNTQGYSSLIPHQSTFATICHVSAFKNADFVLRRILEVNDDGIPTKADLDMHDFLKMLFLWTAYSKVKLPLRDFLETYPKLVAPLLISTIRGYSYIEEHAHTKREEVVEILAEIGEFDFTLHDDDYFVAIMGAACMNLSYSTSPRKYDAKASMNLAFRNYLKAKGVKPPSFPPVRVKKEKPVLAIINEVLNRTHAMFRCYGPTFEALREKFHVIGFGFETLINKNAFDAFDEFVVLPFVQTKQKQIVGEILKRKPDMIIYPSTGMNHTMLPITNIRLAPIQISFLGHPNSMRSPFIDYVACEPVAIPYTKVFAEKVIDFGDMLTMERIEGDTVWEAPDPEKKAKKPHIDIVIPSSVMKLNFEFLSLLKRIKENTTKNLRFHFFPNVVGIAFASAEDSIRQVIPDSIVHPRMSYSDYLSTLATADLHFGPFPFNNTNGNVDSLTVGLPTLVLRGDPLTVGVEGIADASLLESAGAPPELIADNLEIYYDTAIRLIEDSHYRAELQQKVSELDLSNTLFSATGSEKAVAAIWDVYQNHEHYLASDQRVISIYDYNDNDD